MRARTLIAADAEETLLMADPGLARRNGDGSIERHRSTHPGDAGGLPEGAKRRRVVRKYTDNQRSGVSDAPASGTADRAATVEEVYDTTLVKAHGDERGGRGGSGGALSS